MNKCGCSTKSKLRYITRGDEQDSHNPSTGGGGTGGSRDTGSVTAADIDKVTGATRPSRR